MAARGVGAARGERGRTIARVRSVSIILSTYNNPGHLRRALCGYLGQTRRGFEILIADDGSGGETREVVREFRSRAGVRVAHVWHEDRSWRKCRILNKTLRLARSEYVLFSDGDCVPRPDWVEQHARRARPGRFLSGADCRWTAEVTRAITCDDVESGRVFEWGWLRARGMPLDKRVLKVVPPRWLGALMDASNVSRARWSGSNASGWRADLMRVNGFDERFSGWGKEDHELGVRLWNSGVSSRHIRYTAVTYHLDHGKPYFDQGKFEANLVILRETIATRSVRARVGLEESGEDHTVEEANPTLVPAG